MSCRRIALLFTCLIASILFGNAELATAVAEDGQAKNLHEQEGQAHFAPKTSHDHRGDGARPVPVGSGSIIQFRRIYVPADKIDAWPRNGEKYIPVESRDFDRWVRLANGSDSSRSPSATIDFAEYTGSLETERRLSGEGRWTIVMRGDKPAFLPLDGLSIILRNVRWQDAPQQPVRLGLWGKNDGTPTRLGLEVARSGILVFDWHVESHSSDNQVQIPWHVPTASSQRLSIVLPESREPQLDGGVLLESKRQPRDNKAGAATLRRWMIAFNSSHDTNLRILNAGRKIPATPGNIAFRETLHYHVSPRGLDVSATWQITRPADQKQDLILAVPPTMQLTSLKAHGHELAWRIQRDSSAPSDLAIVELPADRQSKPLEITVSAWQPLVAGAPWRLPRLRPEAVQWTAGNFELEVDPAYELERLEPTDCLETGALPLPSSADAPESHSFTAYTQSAAVEIMIKRRLSDATIRAGSSLSLADPDLNGRLVTQWNLARGATHELIGKLAAGWLIESVETIPADAMAEWFVDRHGKQRRLEIQLSHAASAARDVSVIITGRLQRFSLAEPISAETLRMVTWENAHALQHLVSFQSNEPFALQPVGNLPEVADDILDDNDRALLTQTPISRIFELTRAGKNAGLQLSFKRAQYAGQIELEIIDVNGAVALEYRLTALPESTPLNHLIVFSSRPLGKSVRWTDKISNAPIRAEKLAGADAQRLNLPKEGEAWLLRFSPQSARAVEISVSTSAKRSERFSVPLLSLPDASEQHGSIRVRCRSQNLWLEPARLETTPLPVVARGSSEVNLPPICAAYRYEPADCRDVARAPNLWVDPIPDVKTSLLTARHIHLESFFWPDGRGTHGATFQLENRGALKMELPLPAGAQLTNASLDGHSLELAEPTDREQPSAINFPSQARSTKLSLYFETREPPLNAGRKLDAPLVLDRLPFLAGDWVICVPEEYAAEGVGLSNASANFNWRRRLFGILGRPNEARPFNPLNFNSGVPWTNPLIETNVIASHEETSQKPARQTGKDHDKSSLAARMAPTAVTAPGWRRYSEPFIAGGPAPIVVMHPPATAAWAVVSLLLFLMSGRWLRRRGSEVFAVALALAAGVALVVPQPYADPASGAVLGLLLSLLAEWSLRPFSAEGLAQLHRIKTVVAGATAVGIAIGLSKFTLGQSPKTERLPQDVSSSAIQQILIPTDAEGRLSGSKYYVSEKFLRTLISADSDSIFDEGQWLLRDAAATGELREDAARTNSVAGDWALTFSIETLTRDTTILLPLDRGAAEWSTTSMLDGVPQPMIWRDGHTCAIKVAEPGRYSVTIACVPKTTSANGRNQLELAAPLVPGAKVELRFPENTTGLDLPNAIIQPPSAGIANRLNAELDNPGKLMVRWSRVSKLEGGKQGFSLTALHWLDIKPAKTELTVKYVIDGGSHRPDSFTVTYDDDWKLLKDDNPASEELRNTNLSRQHVIRVPILPQATDRQEVLLHWRLAESTSLGNFRLPPAGLTSAPENKHWLAISADPSLEIEIPDSSASDGTVNEFLSKWGLSTSEATPQLVLSNFDPNRAWTLAIRPHEMETSGEETLSVAAGLFGLRVMYEVKATPGNVASYRLELSVPVNLSVRDVVANQADLPVPLRWSRSADNRISIFFGQPLAKPFRLVLDGSVPIDARGQASLPHISTLATESATQKVRLYRDDDVHVDLRGLLPSTESKAEPIDPPPPEWVVRPVAVCYLDNNLATVPRVVVTPNVLKVRGETLTSLTVENGAWWANYRCQLAVEDGELDVLSLRVPSTWSGPFDVQSPVPVTTEVKPIDEQTGMLSIRFATAVTKGKPLELRIRSPLKSADGTTVVAPAIESNVLSHCRRYLAVPSAADSQAIDWSIAGARQANIPQKLLTGITAPTTARMFEIVGNTFQVASRAQAFREISPQIRLADTVVVADEFGDQLIVTRQILSPHGLSQCTLQLPAGQALVAISLDGRPAFVRPREESKWDVALVSRQLPQSLEIVSRRAASHISGSLGELQRPTLLAEEKPIPIEVSLWSFGCPFASSTRLIEGADEVNAIDQAALRFDRLVSIAEVAKTSAAQLPTPDGYNWFQSWATLLLEARSQSQQTIALPRTERSASQVSHTAEDQINQASQRLDKWLEDCRHSLAGSELQQAPPAISDSSMAPALAAPGAGKWKYYVAEGGNERLDLQLQRVEPTTAQVQLIGVLLIVSLLSASLWLMRWPLAADFVCRWPHALGILLGVAYWAWLWPSWLGILIAAGSVWLALRFAWPGRSLRTEGSTVLRSN